MNDESLPQVRRLSAEIGNKMSAARKSEGLTQIQLAERCGAQQALVSRIERGQSNTTVKSLAHLAYAMGYEVSFSLIPISGRHKKRG